MESVKITELLKNAGVNETGAWVDTLTWRESGRAMAVAAVDGTGVHSINVAIEGSHDRVHAESLGTLALSDADGTKPLAIDYPWPYLRAVASGAAGAGTRTALLVTLAK